MLKPTSIHEKEYVEHQVFTDLAEYADFYKSLSFSVIGWLPMGVKGALNIDTYVYSSMQGTLESIGNLLASGRINDAYTLLRKYHDSAIINIYSDLYLHEQFSIDNLVVKQIDDWVNGRKALPRFKTMIQHIENSKQLKAITDLLQSDSAYKDIRSRCDDHTHFNFFKYVVLNDNEVHQERLNHMDTFASDAASIFIQHFAYNFYLNNNYMMSSDYMDSLELGLTPEKDSEYYVAPFIQETFEHIVKRRRPDIAAAILANTQMQLE